MAEAKKKSMNKLDRNKDDLRQDNSDDYSSYDDDEGSYFSSRRSKSTEPSDDLEPEDAGRRRGRGRRGRRGRSHRSKRRRTRSKRR